MLNKISTTLLALGAMLTGGIAVGVISLAHAQGVGTTTTTSISGETTAEPKAHGHAPLGGDGIVASLSGTTIVMTEESNENGASYTIDASGATVTKDGVSAQLSDIKVGDKIFVQGNVSGTNVSATSISLGHPGEWQDKANDTDGTSAEEGSESSSGTSDQ